MEEVETEEIIVRLTMEERDELGNFADSAMEDWLDIMDDPNTSPRGRELASHWAEFWTKLAIKLGCKYEWEVGGNVD